MKEIKMGALGFALFLLAAVSASAEIRQTDHVPWSGYWWPYTEGGLGTGRGYYGYPAPIEKYELLTRGNTPGPLRAWYLQTHYNTEGLPWFGLCYQWAHAASFEEIEFWPSVENNIPFRVGDKKGLMTLAHNDTLELAGNGANPDAFHFWLLKYIGEERRPFMADLDPGIEVWSYPIFKYEMRASTSGSRESVAVTIGYADDGVWPDFMGTQVRHRTYTYDLALDPEGRIIGGEWTGVSRLDHPQRMSLPLAPFSRAPEFDYATVRRIAESRDDELERGEAVVDVAPGTYYLVLMDPDHYRVDAGPGDAVSVEIAKLPGSLQNPDVVLVDGDGATIQSGSLALGRPFSFVTADANPPYTISLTQGDYGAPNLYSLTVDVRRRFVAQIPHIARSGRMWTGFALTNASETPVEGLQMVSVDADGTPVQTLLGPEILPPGGKKLFTFDDLPYRDHELKRTDRLVAMADAPFEVVALFGGSGMGNLSGGSDRANHRHVLPETVSPDSFVRTVFGSVINPSLNRSAAVRLRLFSAAGVLHSETVVDVPPGGKTTIAPGSAPFYHMPEDGWIDVLTDPETPVVAFQYDKEGRNLETLFGLAPVDGQAVVPHVTLAAGPWNTRLTLINLSDETNEIVLSAMTETDGASDVVVSLFPREKRRVDLSVLYGRAPGDPLFRSVVSVSGQAAFSGFFSHSHAGMDDSAAFPLMGAEHVKPELVLPHCPGKGNWWTGIVVANPGVSPVTVDVLPHDDEGRLMTGSRSEVSIEPGRYYLSTAAEMFGDAADRVAFVIFRPTDPAAHLMGVYLYGNVVDGVLRADMATGGIM